MFLQKLRFSETRQIKAIKLTTQPIPYIEKTLLSNQHWTFLIFSNSIYFVTGEPLWVLTRLRDFENLVRSGALGEHRMFEDFRSLSTELKLRETGQLHINKGVMMKYLIKILFLLTLSGTLWAKNEFKEIHVSDLQKLMSTQKTNLLIFDANLESTRKFVGIIPGAHLLSSSSEYEVAKELPTDKTTPLVFYCANEMCTASHSAANRALKAGYSNVSVMVDGIYGWKKSGMPLTPWSNKNLPNAKVDFSDSVNAIEPKEVLNLVKEKSAIVVDVRESEERHQIIENSLWFPMSQLKEESKWEAFKNQLPLTKTIIFHCAAGVRSKKVALLLAKQGYHTSFFQGPDQWEKAGLPLVTGPAH